MSLTSRLKRFFEHEHKWQPLGCKGVEIKGDCPGVKTVVFSEFSVCRKKGCNSFRIDLPDRTTYTAIKVVDPNPVTKEFLDTLAERLMKYERTNSQSVNQ